jgi:hypothetical protein
VDVVAIARQTPQIGNHLRVDERIVKGQITDVERAQTSASVHRLPTVERNAATIFSALAWSV